MPEQTPIYDSSALADASSTNGVAPAGTSPSAARFATEEPAGDAKVSTGSVLSIADEDALYKALIGRGKKDLAALTFASLEEENFLVEKIIRDFEDADAGSNVFKRNMAELWANWRMTTEDKDFPFEGCSNIRVPLTSVFVETMVARMYKAITGGEFIAKMSLLDKQVSVGDLDELNRWAKWELEEVIKIYDWCLNMLRNTLITGIDINIPCYYTETRFLHSTQEFEITDETTSLTDLLQQSIQAILQAPNDWGVETPLEVTKQGRPGDFSLSDGGRIVFSLKEDKAELKADIWKRETIFDGVRINQVQLEDLVVANTHQSIEELPFFGVRCWYSSDAYRRALEDKFFLDLGYEENRRIIGAADVKTPEVIEMPITQLQDRTEGTDSTGESMTSAPDQRFIEVYRWEGWWVWGTSDNDYSVDRMLQPATQCAVWVAVQARRIIKIARLEDLNKDGKRSGVKFGFIEEPGRFYPMGLAEWVRHPQTEIDAIHNQRLDSGLLYNVPFGFYKPTAGLAKSAQPISIVPGKFFPVADPMGINMPRTNWQPSFSFAEEGLVKQYAGEQAGLSGGATGQPISKRQSASEYVGVASALDLRTELFVESLLRSLRELLYRILGLYQQFGPRERIFRVGGEGGVQLTKKFEKSRLQGKLLLEMAGNLSQISEQLQKQTALDMLQLLLQPLLIQMQITGPDTIWAAIDKIARASHYEGVPIHKPPTPPMSDAPEVEEHQMFAGTKPTGPTMGENTAEHMAHHSRTASDTRLMQSWSPQAQQLLSEHIKATLQMEQQQQIVAQQRQALALQMSQEMVSKGINPGKAGGQRPGEGAGPGSEAEGVAGAEASPSAPMAQAA